jgi:hypothetical protein
MIPRGHAVAEVMADLEPNGVSYWGRWNHVRLDPLMDSIAVMMVGAILAQSGQ